MKRKVFIGACILTIGMITMPGDNAFALRPNKDSIELIRLYEDTLSQLQYEKIKPNTSDAYKQEANQKFSALLKKTLQIPGAFDYPFDSLKTLSRLTSPDKKFRILNWDVPKQDGSIAFYGFIQSYSPKKKAYTLYELTDKGAAMSNPQALVGYADNWFGMLYYKIIPCEDDKNTYILLAWQGYSDLITRKIIDVLTFNNDGTPSFGKNLFKKPPEGFKSNCKRIIFQYKAGVYMSLEYDADKKRIIFDHLSPPDPGLTGQYQYYGPSFQIDALQYIPKEKEWDYQQNVDARNVPQSSDKYYHPENEDFNKKKKPLYVPH